MATNHNLSIHNLSDKNILLTGVTGFVGKVVLEKLLRNLKGDGQIYVLIRPNRKFSDACSRFNNEVLSSSLFDDLKQTLGNDFASMCERKIRIVSGEYTEPFFAMDEQEFSSLARVIDVIVNIAASVNFREPLDKALKTNTDSLNNLIQILNENAACSIVHMSTCYVHGQHRGERYEGAVSPLNENANGGIPKFERGRVNVKALLNQINKTVELCIKRHSEEDSEEALIELGLSLAKDYGWNDTYTFTKWLGEELLQSSLNEKRLTIVRPSIVESILKTPTPGWIEGIKVADALILAYAKQKVSFFPGDASGVIDVIPVDMVANAVVLSAAEIVVAEPAARIYQCCSSVENPVQIKDIANAVKYAGTHYFDKFDRLFPKPLDKPFVLVPAWLFEKVTALSLKAETVNQAICSQLGLKVSGKRLANIATAQKLAQIYSFYTSPKCQFSNTNLLMLSQKFSVSEQKDFPVSASHIDWENYLREIHLNGLNKFVLRKPKRKTNFSKKPNLAITE